MGRLRNLLNDLVDAFDRFIDPLAAAWQKAQAESAANFRPLARQADLLPMPIVSRKEGIEHAIAVGESFAVVVRPQTTAFRVDRIVIEDGADWIVNDIKVGNRSQFVVTGDIPGCAFTPDRNEKLRLEAIQSAMDFVMIVTFKPVNNQHDVPRVFRATAYGLSA